MAYVYRHIRLDKNIPFYIGIGSDNKYQRAFWKYGRSKYWHNIVNKGGYEVEIIMDGITWDEACKKEIEFIKLYGKINNNGYLINLTDGGEGNLGIPPKLSEERSRKISETLKRKYASGERKSANIGRIVSEETRLKLSLKSKGRKMSEEAKKKMSLAAIGNKRNVGRITSEVTKQKIGLGNKGKVHSEDQNKKASEFRKGKKLSLAHIEKLRITSTGRKHSEETKKKLSELKTKYYFNIHNKNK